MEGFFGVSEQFHTQADPAFCGLGSLVVALKSGIDDLVRSWKHDLPNALAGATDGRSALVAFSTALERGGAALEVRDAVAPEHREAARAVHDALRATKTFAITGSDVATALALAAPPDTFRMLTPEVLGDLMSILEADRSDARIAPEAARIGDQLKAIEAFASRHC